MVTTRVPVAGGYDRSFTSQELAECWCQVAALETERENELLVTNVEPIQAAIEMAAASLEKVHGQEQAVICVSGSLHAVAASLSLFKKKEAY